MLNIELKEALALRVSVIICIILFKPTSYKFAFDLTQIIKMQNVVNDEFENLFLSLDVRRIYFI